MSFTVSIEDMAQSAFLVPLRKLINYMYHIKYDFCNTVIREEKKMSITNISALRKNLFGSLETVVEYNDTITVNTKKGNAVIISEEEYNAMRETIFLASQPGLIQRIKEGENEDISSMSVYNPNEKW